MTRIAALRAHRVRLPLRHPFVTAVRRADALDTVLVSASDDEGRTGWGEVALSWRVTGTGAAGAEAAITGPLQDAVSGFELRDRDAWGAAAETALIGNAAVRAAVDCALWDLLAQHEGMPLHRLLSTGSSAAVVTDMTLSAAREADVLAAAAEHVGDGFTTLKVKLGTDPDRDDRVLRALRSGPAAEVALRVDANQGWSAADAIRLLNGWEEDGLGVELVEQPTPAGDIEALAEVTAAVRTPVLVDESCWNERDLRELIRMGAADLVNIKLAKSGGITPALRMMELATASGTGVLVGCMLESVVGVTAAAHLAVTLPDAVHDLDGGLWTDGAPLAGGARYDGATIRLPITAGLGLGRLLEEAA
ncbi:mandelate racemase/muconate lactonizing enzyme family protein [Microbacterium halotolerans]|uniref:mandelate racemase/muconate lactonizing enzyme family protein n=1 Tax=Microbacterium halotolerans TaxID=246613 RepID=UPI000E6AAAD2|nr:dipeptide epimerase [Microbacterium halotolerans]